VQYRTSSLFAQTVADALPQAQPYRCAVCFLLMQEVAEQAPVCALTPEHHA
jgi:hypothetical protein